MINSTFRRKPEHTSPERPKPGMETGPTHLNLPHLSSHSQLYIDKRKHRPREAQQAQRAQQRLNALNRGNSLVLRDKDGNPRHEMAPRGSTPGMKPAQRISISHISTLAWNSTLIKRKRLPPEAQRAQQRLNALNRGNFLVLRDKDGNPRHETAPRGREQHLEGV